MKRLLAPILAALALAGCGSSDGATRTPPAQPPPAQVGAQTLPTAPPGTRAPAPEAPAGATFTATKNTTRVSGADPAAVAAGVALAVFPSRSPETRPRAVVLVDQRDWRSPLAAAVLSGAPLRAPILLTEGDELPEVTRAALARLAPTGADGAGRPQVFRVGGAARPDGYRVQDIEGGNFATVARALDRVQATAAGRPSRAVLVASADRPEFAMPAAAWAARSGTPVLWTRRDAVPSETLAALDGRGRARIYVLGPDTVISEPVAAQLRRFGTVKRIADVDAAGTAIAMARYDDAGYGWRIVDPGHGFVFASAGRPLEAAAAAPLSSSGTYGPLLVLPRPDALPGPLDAYLLDVQPGYEEDPTRGVYNHGWLMGDETAISAGVQSRIDALLEIQPVDQGAP